MKKLIYVLAALLIAGGAYWAVFEHSSKKEPVVETVEVVEEPTIEADSVEVVEIAIEETENDETNVELNTVDTNE
jgi:hypothetical protein